MRVLVACEFSGIVRDAFRARGHDAWSLDLLPSERGGQHYQEDVQAFFGKLSRIRQFFGKRRRFSDWDMMIAFPPCTHLAVSGARWFKEKLWEQEEAVRFFMDLVNAPNATAITAIQSGLATLAKLLSYIKSLARSDFAEDADIAGTFDAATDSLQAIRDRGDAAWLTAGGNGGALTLTYTLTSSVDATPIESATIELYAEVGMTSLIASKTTNAFGVVIFTDLIAGTYYLKRIKNGWTFTNPDSEGVSP